MYCIMDYKVDYKIVNIVVNLVNWLMWITVVHCSPFKNPPRSPVTICCFCLTDKVKKLVYEQLQLFSHLC